jgi:hypothetical protein
VSSAAGHPAPSIRKARRCALLVWAEDGGVAVSGFRCEGGGPGPLPPHTEASVKAPRRGTVSLLQPLAIRRWPSWPVEASPPAPHESSQPYPRHSGRGSCRRRRRMGAGRRRQRSGVRGCVTTACGVVAACPRWRAVPDGAEPPGSERKHHRTALASDSR